MEQPNFPDPQEVMRNRLPIVITALVVVSILLVYRLILFQELPPEVAAEFNSLRDATNQTHLQIASARGRIFDRDGQPLAVNALDFQIGVSPNLISNPDEVARDLAAILGGDELEIFNIVNSDVQWEILAPRVNAEVGQAIEALDIPGITIQRIPRRGYPQGTLASHIIGFVGGDLQGYNGVEGYYQDQLSGQIRDEVVSNIPFEFSEIDVPLSDGRDVVLTIDRDIQFLAESELLRSVTETAASGGSIIVMDPRNGDILAMASYPPFDPNNPDTNNPDLLRNPAISEQYEPGSVMKVLTVAGALNQGVITPQWSYNDQGRLNVGGIVITNSDRAAHGLVDTTTVLTQSLNVGAATISTTMGPTRFYQALSDFGIGQATGIDLEGEQAGTMFVPGDPEWSESQLATNAFGQGIAVTPLQLLTAISSIANGGLMMQPRMVYQIIDGDNVITTQPFPLGRPISAETARIVSDMMVAVVNNGQGNLAALPGYSIAGKTGTAEIPTPIGYENNAWIMTFVGFLPADDPQVAVLIKLDRPNGRWASQVAAPVFRRFAERLVILLEIPPDDVRHALAAQGGAVTEVER
ncbi:MAG: penicillin-binding protein 2 [Chloroflexi bacterium]|nr:MAG: penicillin-binding protein 2 [Chloroflexota bacterium]